MISLGGRRNISLKSFATVDPERRDQAMVVANFLDGKFVVPSGVKLRDFPDPLDAANVARFMRVPETENVEEFAQRLRACPKYGVHNPYLRVDRYLKWGEMFHRLATALDEPEVERFFSLLIQRVMPKSYAQCLGEVRITRSFLKSMSGDSVRFLLGRGFSVTGDHDGQRSGGHRFPFGPVAIITPFNFPLEIPVLQMAGALAAGNRTLLKPAEKVAVVADQFVRLMAACARGDAGLEAALSDSLMVLNCTGAVAERLVAERDSPVRLTQFTGSSRVAERLAERTRGRVRIEDAGFNWKILGPEGPYLSPLATEADVRRAVDYVAWQCDQDAYAASGQKCSAQSCLFVSPRWARLGLVEKIKALASRRTLADLTVGPVMSWTTSAMLDHARRIVEEVPGARLAFGGRPLDQSTRPGADIPPVYGAIEPTAIRIPIASLLASDRAFELCTTEVFGPLQIVVDYDDDEVGSVLEACERMSHHLTAAVVSSDVGFVQDVLARTVNGTTYVGVKARTTGAPSNHWFGPAGDVRAAGIGSPEAVLSVWTCHREIIRDDLALSHLARPAARPSGKQGKNGTPLPAEGKDEDYADTLPRS